MNISVGFVALQSDLVLGTDGPVIDGDRVARLDIRRTELDTCSTRGRSHSKEIHTILREMGSGDLC